MPTQFQTQLKTLGFSSKLLAPVGAALAAFFTTWYTTGEWRTQQTVLLIVAVGAGIAGYITGPNPLDHELQTIGINKKLLAATVVAAVAVPASWVLTGEFGKAQVTVLIAAGLAVILGIFGPADRVSHGDS